MIDLSDKARAKAWFNGYWVTKGGNLFQVMKAADWRVGTARDLPITDGGPWDGAKAKAQIFRWAGFDGDNPDSSKARRCFLMYDASEPDLRGSYKNPICEIIDGKPTVTRAGLHAAAPRVPVSDVPQDVKDKARGVVEHYFGKFQEKADDGETVTKGSATSGNFGS